MKPKNRLLAMLAAAALLVVLVGAANATTESINVQSGKDATRTINLSSGDHTSLTFTVVGQAPNNLQFSMVLPNGTTTEYGQTNQFTIDFFTDVEGVCQLHFDNTNATTDQLVSLNYNVEHYVFGIPQMTFMLIFIAVVLICIVAGYIIIGKYS
jgi:hypothetical protein